MKKIARRVLLVGVLLMTGCASQKTWVSNRHTSESEFYADKAYCEGRANAVVGYRSPPVYEQAPIVRPTNYNINCNQYGNSVNCDVRGGNSAQLIADINAQSSNAGAQMGYGLALMADGMRGKQAFEECMQSKGYNQISNEELSEKNAAVKEKQEKLKNAQDRRQTEWVSLCNSERYASIFKKITCKSNDITIKQLADSSTPTDQEKVLILEIDNFSSKSSDSAIADAYSFVEPIQLRNEMISFYVDRRIEGGNLLLELYAGKVSWGEYNKKRQDNGKIFAERWRKMHAPR